jgi:uridine kinase
MSDAPEILRETARAAVALALSRPPTLGPGRLLAIDGPSGSGKSTLAAAVATLQPRATVIHLDDLYDGWDGLAGIGPTLDRLLRPLAAGRPGAFRRYDWHAAGWAEEVYVAPTDLLVIEGVGAGHRAIADLVTALVWIEVAPADGLRRALERDGAAYEAQLQAWQRDEAVHYAVDATRERADIALG